MQTLKVFLIIWKGGRYKGQHTSIHWHPDSRKGKSADYLHWRTGPMQAGLCNSAPWTYQALLWWWADHLCIFCKSHAASMDGKILLWKQLWRNWIIGKVLWPSLYASTYRLWTLSTESVESGFGQHHRPSVPCYYQAIPFFYAPNGALHQNCENCW